MVRYAHLLRCLGHGSGNDGPECPIRRESGQHRADPVFCDATQESEASQASSPCARPPALRLGRDWRWAASTPPASRPVQRCNSFLAPIAPIPARADPLPHRCATPRAVEAHDSRRRSLARAVVTMFGRDATSAHGPQPAGAGGSIGPCFRRRNPRSREGSWIVR